jgi:hypothetical protein
LGVAAGDRGRLLDSKVDFVYDAGVLCMALFKEPNRMGSLSVPRVVETGVLGVHAGGAMREDDASGCELGVHRGVGCESVAVVRGVWWAKRWLATDLEQGIAYARALDLDWELGVQPAPPV